MIKLVAFDLWKTLAYTEGERSRLRLAREAGVSLPIEEIARIFEETIEAKKWYSKYEAYSFFCKKLGLEPTTENVAKVQGIRDQLEATVKLYPHVLPMLLQLRQKKCKTGIISNSSPFAIEQVRKRTDLFKYADYSVFSYELGALKPNVRLFRRMLELANCKPEEAVMVGDVAENDTAPAEKIGMKAILFKDYEQLKKDFAALGIALD